MTNRRSAPRQLVRKQPEFVHQFLIVLSGSDPIVWRRIQVPLAYEEPIDSRGTYPRCVSGSRRCPPEDCGGVHGYLDFLAAISDPRHPEHASSVAWASGSYDPDAFDPAAVVFEDPQKRWKVAFDRQPS